MDRYSRKDSDQVKIPEPLPPEKPGDKEDCGCIDTPATPGGTGGCPTEEYETGGFSLVVRNKTTGRCQWVDLDFIRDDQDDWFPEPPIISYNPNVITLLVQSPMDDAVPENTGGPITNYSIDQDLPDGLTFDTSTGTISGTPTGSPGDVVYIVTAHGPGGDDSTTIELDVVYQSLIIDNKGAIAYEDGSGTVNINDSKTYDFATTFPSSILAANRGYWYWFQALNTGDQFYLNSETPNQVLYPVGTIPSGQWYHDRIQGDLGGLGQPDMANNRANGGVNHIGITSAVVLVANSNPSFRNTITRFQIYRVSDDALMWDGLSLITTNNVLIVSPFVPAGAGEFYYIRISASHNYTVNVHAASITGGGSGGAYNKVFNITSGNWGGVGGNNTFGAPLQIQLLG